MLGLELQDPHAPSSIGLGLRDLFMAPVIKYLFAFCFGGGAKCYGMARNNVLKHCLGKACHTIGKYWG